MIVHVDYGGPVAIGGYLFGTSWLGGILFAAPLARKSFVGLNAVLLLRIVRSPACFRPEKQPRGVTPSTCVVCIVWLSMTATDCQQLFTDISVAGADNGADGDSFEFIFVDRTVSAIGRSIGARSVAAYDPFRIQNLCAAYARVHCFFGQTAVDGARFEQLRFGRCGHSRR